MIESMANDLFHDEEREKSVVHAVNIFVPNYLLELINKNETNLSESELFLFGHHQVTSNHVVNFNITAVLPKSDSIIDGKDLRNVCFDSKHDEYPFHDPYSTSDDIGLARGRGEISNSFLNNIVNNLNLHYIGNVIMSLKNDVSTSNRFSFTFLLNNKDSLQMKKQFKLCLTNVRCFDRPIQTFEHVTIIYYDTKNFMTSQLLQRFNIDDNRVKFVDFINDSLRYTATQFVCKKELDHDQCNNVIEDVLLCRLILLLPKQMIRSFVYLMCRQQQQQQNGPLNVSTKRTDPFVPDWPFIRHSTTFSQIKFRFKQYALSWRLSQDIPRRRRISLPLGNLISSILLDTLLGLIVTLMLHCYTTPEYWLNLAWDYADTMVKDVNSLLRVLQSMPVGLKLNRPLNMALSNFYLYHIFLWESYMVIIRPIFDLVMQAIFYFGIFGFTGILALFTDIFSLVTIHIFCFYGYGCQLYNLQILGISALWRLFRGKKWNQLRSRVDSYSYNNEQLFIGTILFTILLFLLPTVIMYYLVFLVLRFMTLAVQEGLLFFIEHISTLPTYTILLWLMNSRTICGQMFVRIIEDDDDDDELNGPSKSFEQFQLYNNISGRPLIVQLETKRISLLKIINNRYDDLLQSLTRYRQMANSSGELKWNEFIMSVLTGQRIHQNLSIGLSLSFFIGYLLFNVYFSLRTKVYD